MKYKINYILASIFTFVVFMGCKQKSNDVDHYDTYHGISIKDNYRYIENIKDTTVIKWLHEKTDSATSILNNIPNQEKLISLQKKFSISSTGSISNIQRTESGSFYFLKRNKDDNFSKLYFKKNIEEKEELIFDPKDYKPQSGIAYYINYYKLSWDNKKILLSFAERGNEISEMKFYDIEKKGFYDITMNRAMPDYGGVYWLVDNSGVTYLQIPKQNLDKDDKYLNTEVVLQRLDSSSEIVFSRKNNPELKMKPEDIPVILIENENDNYVIAAIAGATPYHDYYVKNYKDFIDKKNNWTPLFQKKHKPTVFYQDKDSIIYLEAGKNPNFRISKISLENPKPNNPFVIVEEKKDKVIKNFKLLKDGIVYTTTKNGVQSELYYLTNKQTEKIKLPNPAGSISIKTNGRKDNFLAIKIKGWLNKQQRYEYNFVDKKFIQREIVQTTNFDLQNDFIAEELEVKSHDGELVPLSLIYKKGISKDGSNPTLMIGYGSYGASATPLFSKKIMTWVSEGGIYAVAHIRGGGEKGDSWYKGGFKSTKPNTWKDFISCAEFLIKNKYTSKSKFAINGASAGGITIGRAITERPDLFAAAIINVGFLNTILLESDTNGANNAKEFGYISKEDEFKWLLEMDSFHHLKEGEKYPATLLTTGINDKRVPPWDPAKFAAKLTDYNGSDNPILFKVDFESGHGSAGSINKSILNTANVLAFAFWQTGHPEYQPE